MSKPEIVRPLRKVLKHMETLYIGGLAAASALAGLAVTNGGIAGGAEHQTNHPTHNSQPKPGTKHVNRLEIGDKLTDVKVLKAGIGKSRTYDLKPSKPGKMQDLCVVYAPGQDIALNQAVGDRDPKDAAGILFTAANNEIRASYVAFNNQAQVVTAISPGAQIKNGEQLLINWVPAGSETGFEVDIDATGNASDELLISVHNIQVGPGNTTQPTGTTA